MWLTSYRRVLAAPGVRLALLLGMLIRVPVFAGSVVLALHVVSGLGLGYSSAGVVVFLYTAMVAVSAPWRGRLLDRLGLRRVVLPSLVVLTVCWSTGPFLGFVPLLVTATLAGLFNIPVFSIIRQTIMASVADGDRRTALSAESVAVELAYMIGPLVGVFLATTVPTSWALASCELTAVAAGAVLWYVDPPLRREDVTVLRDTGAAEASTASPEPGGFRGWFSPGLVALLLIAGCATIVLTGTDISLIALMRESESTALLGVVLAVWGLGSAIGGLVYGALRRPVPAWLLLLCLGAVTLPVGVAHTFAAVLSLVFVAGLLCAPTLTATIDELTGLIDPRHHGEALGWHGSSLMTGSALGAPLAGMAIDHGGAALGLAVVALVGLAVALGAGGLRQGRRVLLARRLGPPLATTEDSAGTIREVQHENRVRATR